MYLTKYFILFHFHLRFDVSCIFNLKKIKNTNIILSNIT